MGLVIFGFSFPNIFIWKGIFLLISQLVLSNAQIINTNRSYFTPKIKSNYLLEKISLSSVTIILLTKDKSISERAHHWTEYDDCKFKCLKKYWIASKYSKVNNDLVMILFSLEFQDYSLFYKTIQAYALTGIGDFEFRNSSTKERLLYYWQLKQKTSLPIASYKEPLGYNINHIEIVYNASTDNKIFDSNRLRKLSVLQSNLSPSESPSFSPTSQPTTSPTNQKLLEPSLQPVSRPTISPTSRPSSRPTYPSSQPTSFPSNPSNQPSSKPSSNPTLQPSRIPSSQPSKCPSKYPTSQPSEIPSSQPTGKPSFRPTNQPSLVPTNPSAQPSSEPTIVPSKQPITQPSNQPSVSPTKQPFSKPSRKPSSQPSKRPSRQPTKRPSAQPTGQPRRSPSSRPSLQPSGSPSAQPYAIPTNNPSKQPTALPTLQPITEPSACPSSQPYKSPTGKPTSQPSSMPSIAPSKQPSTVPSVQPSALPSSQPKSNPTINPTSNPSSQPSTLPSYQPVGFPSRQPTTLPSSLPSSQPVKVPSCQPSVTPSGQPSHQPLANPSSQPTYQPTFTPTCQPSSKPTLQPSIQPKTTPTMQPTSSPSSQPSSSPSRIPSIQPSSSPTSQPRDNPSAQPTCQPNSSPSSHPSGYQIPVEQVTFNPVLGSLSVSAAVVVCLLYLFVYAFGHLKITEQNVSKRLEMGGSVYSRNQRRYAIFVRTVIPMLDATTNVAYFLAMPFYSMALCSLTALFLLQSISIFLQRLLLLKATFLGFNTFQRKLIEACRRNKIASSSNNSGNEDKDFMSIGVSGVGSGEAWRGAQRGREEDVPSKAQTTNFAYRLLIGLVYLPFVLLWFVFGAILQHLNLFSVGNLWSFWFGAWVGGEDHFDVEFALIDTKDLSDLLFIQIICETIPQIALQSANNLLVGGWNALAIVSLLCSVLCVLLGVAYRIRSLRCSSNHRILGQAIPIELHEESKDWAQLIARGRDRFLSQWRGCCARKKVAAANSSAAPPSPPPCEDAELGNAKPSTPEEREAEAEPEEIDTGPAVTRVAEAFVVPLIKGICDSLYASEAQRPSETTATAMTTSLNANARSFAFVRSDSISVDSIRTNSADLSSDEESDPELPPRPLQIPPDQSEISQSDADPPQPRPLVRSDSISVDSIRTNSAELMSEHDEPVETAASEPAAETDAAASAPHHESNSATHEESSFREFPVFTRTRMDSFGVDSIGTDSVEGAPIDLSD